MLLLGTAILLTACGSGATPLANPSASQPLPTASTQPSPATATRTPTASPTAEPTERPSNTDLKDELVAVVTDDLVVRSSPGTGSASEIYRVRLNAPTLVYVIDGPEQADGFAWYLVDPLTPACYLGCDFEPQPGWVAAAGQDGERWLADEPEDAECPQPTLEELSASFPEVRLHCFGSQELTLSGVVWEARDARPGWPWEHSIDLYEPGWKGPVTGCVDACNIPLLTLVFDGDLAVPPEMSATQLTGHFDDPQSSECRWSGFGIEPDQRLLTHECRMVFVVTSWN